MRNYTHTVIRSPDHFQYDCEIPGYIKVTEVLALADLCFDQLVLRSLSEDSKTREIACAFLKIYSRHKGD